MKKRFTLVEVLIALAILSLGILAGTGLLASARERCRKAERQWQHQHALTQAAEFHLLAGANADMPERVFPYPELTVAVRQNEARDLPNGISNRIEGWRLATMEIELRDADNTLLEKMSVDRIVKTWEKQNTVASH